jgi:hypothetical protein
MLFESTEVISHVAFAIDAEDRTGGHLGGTSEDFRSKLHLISTS